MSTAQQIQANINTVNENEAKLIARLTAENEAMRAELSKPKANGLGMKVSAKGAVSIYGMGKFPVTLYAEQWIKLAVLMPEILKFVEANKAVLTTKAPKA